MTREELLAPLQVSAPEADAFADWEIIPGFVGGEHVCTAVLKGTEIHFGLVPDHRFRAIQKARAQAFIAPLLDRLGFLTTRVMLGSIAKRQFVERIGFKPTWADDRFQYYLLGAVPFSRSEHA